MQLKGWFLHLHLFLYILLSDQTTSFQQTMISLFHFQHCFVQLHPLFCFQMKSQQTQSKVWIMARREITKSLMFQQNQIYSPFKAANLHSTSLSHPVLCGPREINVSENWEGWAELIYNLNQNVPLRNLFSKTPLFISSEISFRMSQIIL